jgi:hypothetical protein
MQSVMLCIFFKLKTPLRVSIIPAQEMAEGFPVQLLTSYHQ